MTHELPVLSGAGVVYLLLLFLIAYATEQGKLPDRWVNNPWVYTLSLGVYATSWTYYGSVGFAVGSGFQFLTIYIGVTLAFVLSPVLLRPILRLTQEYQLSSLADLFAFRYRSQLAGILVTLFMLMGTLPYIALQIRAVTQSLQVLTDEAPPHILALGFCITLTVFAILFGARHISPREKHAGLVVAIAFESLVKLLALLAVGLFALFGVFDGPQQLSSWLSEHPQAIESLYQPVGEDPWLTLIMLSFAAAFLLPRQFHMLFAENLNEAALKTASWSFPLFLLLLNLFIPVILWAGQYLQLAMDPDYFVLGITLQQGSTWMPLLTFIGGISAASAMVIVTTLALSSMCLNHLLLPASYPDPQINLYYWLLWGRRFLIGTIILAGYSFYAFLDHREGLVQTGPDLVCGRGAVPARHRRPAVLAPRHGQGFYRWPAGGHHGMDIHACWCRCFTTPRSLTRDLYWHAAASQQHGSLEFCQLLVAGTQRPAVRYRVPAHAPAPGRDSGGPGLQLGAALALGRGGKRGLAGEFSAGLAATLGRTTSEKEVGQALADLAMDPDERRPSELRRLRERIERNLSGLIGPQMAHMVINQQLRLDPQARTALADSMRFLEERLADSHSRLEGLTADLDRQRRYHRRILLELPLGVCSLSGDGRVVIWNLAMEVMTRVKASQALGHQVDGLPHPGAGSWRGSPRPATIICTIKRWPVRYAPNGLICIRRRSWTRTPSCAGTAPRPAW